MEADRFDTLTRTVGSRRGILAAALGGLPLFGPIDAVAKKRKKRKHRQRKPCKHFKVKFSCVDRCDTKFKTSTCGDYLRCKTCQGGKTCLPNKTCGVSCASAACPEGSGCTCSTTDPRVCLAPFTTCDDLLFPCETIDDCPFRFTCDETPCGAGNSAEKRCRPLCVA